VAIFGLLCAARLGANTFVWIGTTSGVWSDNFQWAPNSQPGAGDVVDFTGSSAGTSTVDGFYNIGFLQLLNTSVMTINSTGGGNLFVSSTVLYGGGATADIFVNVPISGTATLSLTGGTGTLTLNPGTGSNTFTGTTDVSVGTLADGEANSLSANSDLRVGGGGTHGTVNLGFNEMIKSFRDFPGGNGVINISSGATLTTIGDSSGFSYSGTIAGNGGLTKSGVGTQILTGVNTYTGSTSIGSGTTLQLGDGTTNGSINATSGVSGSGSLSFNFNGPVTVPEPLTGSLSIVQQAGTTTLSGANSYSGTTTVTASTLKAGSSTALGSASDVTLTTSTLDLNGNNLSIGSLISDSSSTVLLGSNTLTLTDSFSSGFGGSMTGTGGLFVNGSGEFEILGAVTYTGGTTIGPSGYLSLGINSRAGASMVGSIVDNGTFQLAPFTAENYHITGDITGTGQVRVVGAGTVTLDNAGNNAYSGITDAVSSVLTDGSPFSFSPNSSVYLSSGATLAVTQFETIGSLQNGGGAGSVTIAPGVTLTSSGQNHVNDFQGVISGAGGFVLSAGIQGLSGNNTYTGGTVITGIGELFVGSDTALGIGILNFNGVSTEMSPDANVTLGNAVVLNSTFDNDDGGSNNMTFNGQISGPAGITWCAPGTLTLTNANTFTGPVDMREGTLVVGNNAAAGVVTNTVTLAGNINSGLNVMGGVTFSNPLTISGTANAISGNGTISSPAITVDGTVVLSPSASPGGGPGNLTFTNSLTLASGAAIHFSILDANGSAGTGYSLVTASGGLSFTASPNSITFNIVSVDSSGISANAINFNAGTPYSWTIANASSISGFSAADFHIDASGFLNDPSGSFNITQAGNSLDLNFTPVPEPSTWALIGAGTIAVAGFSLRRRRPV
jgi:fibronectin-binding autotransporter adhesin